MFGLSPQGKDDNMTLARYFHRLKLTSENQITLQRQSNGSNLVTFGSTPKGLNHTWVSYWYERGFWTFGTQEMRLGNSTLLKNSTKADTILSNAYRYIVYETKEIKTAHNFFKVMNDTFLDKEIKNSSLRDGKGWKITVSFPKNCNQVRDQYAEKIQNLTLITEYGKGRTLHIDAEKLFFEFNEGLNCEFGLYMVFNPMLPEDKLVLGLEFLRLYDLSLNFGTGRIGFDGYTTDPPPLDPTSKDGNKLLGILIGVGAAFLILIIIGIVVSKLKQSKLRKDLNQADERLV